MSARRAAAWVCGRREEVEGGKDWEGPRESVRVRVLVVTSSIEHMVN